MQAKLDNNLIRLSFEQNQAVLKFLRKLPGRKFWKATGTWSVPLTIGEQNVQKLAKLGFAVDPAINEAIKSDMSAAKEAERLAVQPDAAFASDLPLLPYQRAGAAFLQNIGSGLLGDEVGLGKTIQSLAVVEAGPAARILVMCPAILKYQWESELQKFIPDANCQVIDGSQDERNIQWQAPAKYFIANYELLLRPDFEHMERGDWDYIIADEATRISNPHAKQSKAIKRLRARFRLALTGTPVSNRPDELWNLIDFCWPGALGSYQQFIDRYAIKDRWGGIFGYHHMAHLQARLKRYMIRRLKADVLQELPEKIITDLPVKLSGEEMTLYNQIRKEVLFEIDRALIDKIENPATIQYTMVKMMRLRQVANGMELVGSGSTSSKLEALKELLTELENRKIIIFTEFAAMADIIARELPLEKARKISGMTSQKERQDILARFNTDPAVQYLIMTSAGQFGLNIQAASVIINYDLPWSIAKLTQREGRAHRMGQKQNVLVYNLIGLGTMDTYIRRVLHKKHLLAGEMFGDPVLKLQDLREMLTDAD